MPSLFSSLHPVCNGKIEPLEIVREDIANAIRGQDTDNKPRQFLPGADPGHPIHKSRNGTYPQDCVIYSFNQLEFTGGMVKGRQGFEPAGKQRTGT